MITQKLAVAKSLNLKESDLYSRALQLAIISHEGQLRKSTGLPMITHPIKVADILKYHQKSLNVQIAGLLHDVVEDTFVELSYIYQEFGNEIGDLVASNSEDKNKSWEDRKTHTIESVKILDSEKLSLLLADKYSNLYDLHHNIKEVGKEKAYSFFKRGEEYQQWYFKSIMEEAEKIIPTDSLFLIYKDLCNKTF